MEISEKKKKEALELKAKYGYKDIYINEKGEFFSTENYAKMSVAGDKKKYAKVEEGTVTNKTVQKNANELIKEVATIEDLEVLENLIKDETRKTVIDAIERRIVELKDKENK
jgi:hypothetical protein